MSVRAAAGALCLLATAAPLAACGPSAPPGVDRARLDDAVSRAIGDPNTCVLIGEAGSGKLLYRYNTHVACGRSLPDCRGGQRKIADLLQHAAKAQKPETISCPSKPDPSRSVAWAAGAIENKPYVYAAVMEGAPDRTLPGLVIADRLARAFADAGL